MLLTNFKSAWRNLLRYPFSSAINIAGLTIGIICCVFISLYVWSELQADEFHAKKKNIFRVNVILPGSERAPSSNQYPLGTSLLNEYPEISKIVRLGQDNVSLRVDQDSYFYEDQFYWADSSFFEVFSFPLLKGDPSSALKNPYSLILTEAMAKKYFNDADPLGKTVEVKIYDGDRKFSFTVTGVVKDLPENSTIQFDFLASMHTAIPQVYPQLENSWNLYWVSTYALVTDPDAIVSREKQAAAFFEKYAGEEFIRGLEFQPLSRIHLYSGHVGNNLSDGMMNIYIFSVIGIFILLLACVNFVNISTARAALRKKEIGVRKVLGAVRRQIFFQFMAEAILTAVIVLVVAFAVVAALQPLVGGYISGTPILFSAFLLPIIFLSSLILISLLAGLYPATFLSSFKPLEALKSTTEKTKGIGFTSRHVLVVFQFAISIALIAGTLIIQKQVHYLKRADLGMITDKLITIPVDDRELQKKINTIRNQIATLPGMTGVSATGESFPAAMNNSENITWQGHTENDLDVIDIISIDYDYFDLLKATFIEGRNISRSYGTDDSAAFIINEAAREMLQVNEAVGKEITIGGRTGKIVGVTKNIHHYSLHQKVEPIAYFPVRPPSRACSDNLILKISPEAMPSTLASLKQIWQGLTQDRPFEYHFADDEFARAYEQEEKFLTLFEAFSALAIIIAGLGLMGLSSFVVTRRSKEIGIRKVLGASASQILLMLTRGFSIPIFIAFLISCPGVYYAMNQWLNKFAYKVNVDLWLFFLSGISAWLIAFCFIGFQSWKAALINPAEILKNE